MCLSDGIREWVPCPAFTNLGWADSSGTCCLPSGLDLAVWLGTDTPTHEYCVGNPSRADRTYSLLIGAIRPAAGMGSPANASVASNYLAAEKGAGIVR